MAEEGIESSSPVNEEDILIVVSQVVLRRSDGPQRKLHLARPPLSRQWAASSSLLRLRSFCVSILFLLCAG